jgi:hypothetical protein
LAPLRLKPGDLLFLADHEDEAGSACLPVIGMHTGFGYLLTAAHVAGALALGGDNTSEVRTNRLGPTPTGSLRVGVTRASVPPAATNTCLVDAAVVALASFVSCSRDAGYAKVGADYYDPYDPALLGLQVMKMGSTTGSTFGEIVETAVSYEANTRRGPIRYLFGYKIMSLVDDVPFSLPGDSGALVTDLAGRPVGMVVAMDDAITDPSALSFSVPIAFIFEALDVRPIGQCPWSLNGVEAAPL